MPLFLAHNFITHSCSPCRNYFRFVRRYLAFQLQLISGVLC